MAEIALLMMQKDEVHLLWPWIRYHGSRFGYENCHVFDNGSVDASVRRRLQDAEALGVNVIYDHDRDTDYDRKNELIISKIGELRERGAHRAFLPLDCDEFLAVEDDGKVSLRGELVRQHIDDVCKDGDYYLRVGTRYMNSPLAADRFYKTPFAKVILLPGSRTGTPGHGFHMKSLEEAHLIQTRLVYIEFHNRPYKDLRRSAREKLALRLPDFSEETLRNYQGRGHHLTKYLLMTEKEYLRRSHRAKALVEIGLSAEFRELGVDYPFLGACR